MTLNVLIHVNSMLCITSTSFTCFYHFSLRLNSKDFPGKYVKTSLFT